MTDLERVARAIFAVDWRDDSWDCEGEIFEGERNEAFNRARAAIEALMEASEWPLQAGICAANLDFEDEPRDVFRAILCAVLEGR